MQEENKTGKILNETNRELEPSDIPCENYWLRGIESWEDLADIGGNNIRALISICRRYEGYRRDSIKENKYFSEFGQEDDRKRLIIIRRCIKGLQEILREMPESDLKKPYLSHLRPNDLFKLGDRVVILLPYPQEGVYIPRINRELKGKDWVMATVVAPEMEAQFHTVVPKYPKKTVVCLTDIPSCGSVAGGVDPRYQMFRKNDHEVIPEEEFKYLSSNTEFLEIWINNINPDDPEELREKIKRANVVEVVGEKEEIFSYKKTVKRTTLQRLAKEFKAASGDVEAQKAILDQMKDISNELGELATSFDDLSKGYGEELTALKKMLETLKNLH